MSGCSSGYKYSLIEDNNYYLLKGRHYNNHPCIWIKARLPNSYLVTKNLNDNIATTKDIQSTNLRGDEILDGFIVDYENLIEIHLLIFDHQLSKKRIPAWENGTYLLENRTQVENLRDYVLRENESLPDNYKYPVPADPARP